MRLMTISLLLLVCFFGGMTYGSVETNHALSEPDIETEAETETIEMEPFSPEELKTTETAAIDEDTPVVHRAATLFEKIILSIYNFLIELMYATAELFF